MRPWVHRRSRRRRGSLKSVVTGFLLGSWVRVARGRGPARGYGGAGAGGSVILVAAARGFPIGLGRVGVSPPAPVGGAAVGLLAV